MDYKYSNYQKIILFLLINSYINPFYRFKR